LKIADTAIEDTPGNKNFSIPEIAVSPVQDFRISISSLSVFDSDKFVDISATL